MNAQTLARLNARAAQDRAGYPAAVKSEVISVQRLGPDGQPIIHQHNTFPGPLDGKPRCNHHARFTYADGTVVTVGPDGVRDKPWPGGQMSIA